MQKKNKNVLNETMAPGMGKTVVDQLGLSDQDMSGRGSQLPPPVVAGAPLVPSSVGKPGVPVTMTAMAARSAAPKASDEEVEETEETEETEAEEMEENVSYKLRSALVQLLGEDNASEELLGNLEAIFEAAVTERVEDKLTQILVELDEGVKTQLNTITEALVEKVDDYLDYVVEEWMQENAVAVEQGIKTQIAENFIGGLKNLFENHYIDVPNEKYNILDELYAQNRDLQEQLNKTVNESINVRKELALTECAGIFVAETRDLADTQVAKLQNLMENVNFASPDEYRQKLVAIKENYLKRPTTQVSRPVEVEDVFTKPVNSSPTTLVENYVSALGRLNKKV
jgi:hypothetical protein